MIPDSEFPPIVGVGSGHWHHVDRTYSHGPADARCGALVGGPIVAVNPTLAMRSIGDVLREARRIAHEKGLTEESRRPECSECFKHGRKL